MKNNLHNIGHGLQVQQKEKHRLYLWASMASDLDKRLEVESRETKKQETRANSFNFLLVEIDN